MSTWHNFRAAIADEWVTGSVHYRVQLGRITRACGCGRRRVGACRHQRHESLDPRRRARDRRAGFGRERRLRRGCTGGCYCDKNCPAGARCQRCANGVHLLPHKPWQALRKGDVVEVVIQLRDVQFFVNGKLVGHLPKPQGRLRVRVCVGLMYAEDTLAHRPLVLDAFESTSKHRRRRSRGQKQSNTFTIRSAPRTARPGRTWQAWSARSDARHVDPPRARRTERQRRRCRPRRAPCSARPGSRRPSRSRGRRGPRGASDRRRRTTAREGLCFRDLRPPPLDREPIPVEAAAVRLDGPEHLLVRPQQLGRQRVPRLQQKSRRP